MRLFKYVYWKCVYWYHRITLRIFYNKKPNKNGTFDIESCPSFPNAMLKNDDLK